jgi:hypothetical protein
MAYKIKQLLLNGCEAFDPKIARRVGERAEGKESSIRIEESFTRFF